MQEKFAQTYTDRFRSSLMALISIFLRPILTFDAHVTFEPVDATDFEGVVLSRPISACVALRWGNRDKENATSACE